MGRVSRALGTLPGLPLFAALSPRTACHGGSRGADGPGTGEWMTPQALWTPTTQSQHLRVEGSVVLGLVTSANCRVSGARLGPEGLPAPSVSEVWRVSPAHAPEVRVRGGAAERDTPAALRFAWWEQTAPRWESGLD